jgi:hypothetical protein
VSDALIFSRDETPSQGKMTCPSHPVIIPKAEQTGRPKRTKIYKFFHPKVNLPFAIWAQTVYEVSQSFVTWFAANSILFGEGLN